MLGRERVKRRSCWSSWHTAGGFSGSSPSVPPARTGSTSRVPEQSWFTAANSGSCSQQHLSRAFHCLRTLGTKPPGLGSVKKKNNPSSSRGTGLGRCSEQQHSQGIFLWTPGWVSLGLLAFIYIPRVSHENNIILFRFHGSLI